MMQYDQNIYFLDGEEDLRENYRQISIFPDYCPVCNLGIHAKYFLFYIKNSTTIELLCGCPREVCSSLFIVEYTDINETPNSRDLDYQITKYYPKVIKETSFSDEVNTLFPSFVKIYSQALHAENEGLDLICGVGFRKSIEYLIKDYAVSMKSEDEEKIKNMHLQQCITNYINHPTIKEMSKRAVWLGNDETHIVRKWKNKDLQDLKKLIDLTVHYIGMEILAKQYEAELS